MIVFSTGFNIGPTSCPGNVTQSIVNTVMLYIYTLSLAMLQRRNYSPIIHVIAVGVYL